MTHKEPGFNRQFLKLGGSLITDKNRPHTPRLEVIERLAREIASALEQRPELRLLLGHGSGSFGHTAAHKHGTRQGVAGPEQWQGFIEVWREAAALNHLVMDALLEAGLPAIAFPPSGSVTAQKGQVSHWNLEPISAALEAGLLPVVYGDVVFDAAQGGTILSTEDIFAHLASELKPTRLLLAGIEPGVWADFPVCRQLMPHLTSDSLPELEAALSGSNSPDVTGGMLSKVHQSLALARQHHSLIS
jgi:isopentenyl phosphate kinase